MSVDGPVAAPPAPYDRNTKRAPVACAIWRNTASAWSSDSDETTGKTLMPRLTADRSAVPGRSESGEHLGHQVCELLVVDGLGAGGRATRLDSRDVLDVVPELLHAPRAVLDEVPRAH